MTVGKILLSCVESQVIGDPGGDQDPMQYLNCGFYPVQAPYILYMQWSGKLSPSLWTEVDDQHNVESLRDLAKRYDVSYETIRRTLIKSKTGVEQTLLDN